MQQNPPCELSSCFSTVWLYLLVPKSGDSLKEQTEKILPDKLLFKKKRKKEKSIPNTLEFKAKYIKRRRLKKVEYKYILGKSMPPKTNLSLFLIITSKNYIFHLKNVMKSAEPWCLAGKCPRVLVLIKILNSTQTFLLPSDVVVVPLQKHFLLTRWQSC